MSTISFYLIAAFILITGFLTVTTRRLFRSAIALLFSLIGIAALYFWMEVEFAAAVQIIVYVGGIVVLIIFSIFLTNNEGVNMLQALSKRSLFSGIAVLCAAAFTCMLIGNNEWSARSAEVYDPAVKKIGYLLVSNSPQSYVLPFELVSILLLAAMIGCIVIAMKPNSEEQ
ncbi:NADH-quinone oxidoreductase subunit J [soil metagenome]